MEHPAISICLPMYQLVTHCYRIVYLVHLITITRGNGEDSLDILTCDRIMYQLMVHMYHIVYLVYFIDR